jgi:hypothetical protein
MGFEPIASAWKAKNLPLIDTCYPNKIKKDIINPNRAIASVNANPSIAYTNNCGPTDGFRAKPKISAPKTVPIPTPVPASEIVAKPAPMYLQPFNILKLYSKKLTITKSKNKY